ncbi:endonuclease III domain-containing protein [Desulfopila sp. IMCC35006]|uniref:endonuclease III domain-containing protein n=1 Tax=Desulfopila sp. IMCC35006 TaxID=2569542 RepID=UPI001F0E958F|nr:endonuclease III domain-containing protein [Desulfopila sp. IMCC35006]
MKTKSCTNNYTKAYRLLYEYFGPQGWWPGDSPFEIMVGAILTQNTNWSNVRKAIDNLKFEGLLSYQSLSLLTAEEIAQYIRPAGYYNLKAQRLKNLLNMVAGIYAGDLAAFLDDELGNARENLLAVKGIGPETADSILLYACGHPVFVVDMYTHRVFSRHNMVEEETDYLSIQDVFLDNLPQDKQLFNEFHALIVRVAGTFCKKTKPLCAECPLNGLNL